MKGFVDDELNQYILDAVAMAPPDQVRLRLRAEDYEALRDLNRTSLEQRLTILGRLGRRFAVVVMDRKKVIDTPITQNRIFAMLRFFRHKTRKLLGSNLKEWGLFIRADREIYQALNAASGYLSGKSQYLFRNYDELSNTIENLGDIKVSKRLAETRAVLIDRFLREAFRAFYLFESQSRYNLRPQNIPLLFLFSAQPKEWLTFDDIMVYQNTMSRKRTGQVMLELLDAGIVDEIKGDDEVRLFQLTAYGAFIADEVRRLLTFNANP